MVPGTASPGWRLNACVPSGLWNLCLCNFGTVEPMLVQLRGCKEYACASLRDCGTYAFSSLRDCGTYAFSSLRDCGTYAFSSLRDCGTHTCASLRDCQGGRQASPCAVDEIPLGITLLKEKSNGRCRSPADGPEIERNVFINFGVVPRSQGCASDQWRGIVSGIDEGLDTLDDVGFVIGVGDTKP